ncbi:MAG TPA: hypothetical protein VLF14_07655 [Candidatus Binatia bacterium]|nr:hypothetical protein [Candidatus Binatia bacterium]
MPTDERPRFEERHAGGEHRPRARIVALVEEGQHAWEELFELIDAARRARREGRDLLREVTENNPYLALAIAAAGGYVLGGGVPRWLTRVAFDVAGRMAGLVVAERIASMAVNRASKPAP